MLARFGVNLLRRRSLHVFDKRETVFAVFPFLLETLGFAAAVFAKCNIKGDFTCKLACYPMFFAIAPVCVVTGSDMVPSLE